MVFTISSVTILALYWVLINVLTTTKTGSSSACASCKYQRKKCSKECPLAPFFPPNEPKKFQFVHRLFGVCKVLKILKQVTEAQKEDAMKSIIYEADMRARFPVDGCCFVISQLQYQIQTIRQQLVRVHNEIAKYRHQQVDHDQYQILAPSDYSLSSKVQSGLIDNYSPFVMANEFRDNRNEDLMKTLSIQELPQILNSTNSLSRKFEMDVSYCYDIGMEFDSVVDDRQSYINSKEACESNEESALKDSTQSFITENDLKSAAACFSLRSIK